MNQRILHLTLLALIICFVAYPRTIEEGELYIRIHYGRTVEEIPIVDIESISFATQQYTLTTYATDGTVSGAGRYDYNSDVTLHATADYGYTFSHWDDGNRSNPRHVILTSDSIFTAEFTINQYTLTTYAANGTVSGGGAYDYNSDVTLHATADYGYTFSHWDDGNRSNPRVVALTSDTIFRAKFTIDQYLIQTDGDHVSITGAGLYDYNTTIILTALPDPHYEFVGWQQSQNGTILSTSSVLTLVVNHPEQYIALTRPIVYTISYDYNGMPIGQPLTSPYTIEDDIALIRPEGDIHYEFINWGMGIQLPTTFIDRTSQLPGGDVLLYAHYKLHVTGAGIELLLDGDVLGVANRDNMSEVVQSECIWYRDHVEIGRGKHYLYVGNPVPFGLYRAELVYKGVTIAVLEREFLAPSPTDVSIDANPISIDESITIIGADIVACQLYTLQGDILWPLQHIYSDRVVIGPITHEGIYMVRVQAKSGVRLLKVIVSNKSQR